MCTYIYIYQIGKYSITPLIKLIHSATQIKTLYLLVKLNFHYMYFVFQLSETAKERAVPATRLSRVVSFGSKSHLFMSIAKVTLFGTICLNVHVCLQSKST